ncbi:hypothetical protein K0M31_003901 [Melipona bicolor]|uniref:Uncharacterized protein n=1 Tax=Melipona bicolor TaxID=60889 RepID=A0AA40FYK7_9HYME|nr:hypothetical protein K0M31_003901 [Melipona bicolor]
MQLAGTHHAIHKPTAEPRQKPSRGVVETRRGGASLIVTSRGLRSTTRRAFPSGDNRALIGWRVGELGAGGGGEADDERAECGGLQEFGASEISENLWRGVPTNFESQSRNILTRGRAIGGRMCVLLPAGWGGTGAATGLSGRRITARQRRRGEDEPRGPNFSRGGGGGGDSGGTPAITMAFPLVIARCSQQPVYFDNWAFA